MSFKAGFVNIIGNPNAGKSSLLNKLIGEALAVTNAKAQTTRHRILGILNGNNYQIVFSDTPGIIIPAYKLQQSMMKAVNEALKDADIILLVIDCIDNKPLPEQYLNRVLNASVPVFILFNKIDLLNQEQMQKVIDEWTTKIPDKPFYPCSAKAGFGIQQILEKIISTLPENPPYFPENEISDRTVRFFVSEIIRGNILKYYDKEIPYSVEVVVESYTEKDNIDHILCNIMVSRESQKGIIIGDKGKAIKKLSIKSRREIETFLQKKVFLRMFVKVDKDWRENPTALKKYGYEE